MCSEHLPDTQMQRRIYSLRFSGDIFLFSTELKGSLNSNLVLTLQALTNCPFLFNLLLSPSTWETQFYEMFRQVKFIPVGTSCEDKAEGVACAYFVRIQEGCTQSEALSLNFSSVFSCSVVLGISLQMYPGLGFLFLKSGL